MTLGCQHQSYDEVRRFNSSAAHAAAHERDLTGISSSDHGLIQVVADNFDAHISSQNGLKSTHALSILVSQAPSHLTDKTPPSNMIKRVSREEMSEDVTLDIPIQRY